MDKIWKLIEELKAENEARIKAKAVEGCSKYNYRKLGHEIRLAKDNIERLEKAVAF